MFSLRIVNIEWSMKTPVPGLDKIYSDFRKSDVFKTPVITIFGSTPEGQKCCLCLHGIYPYIFVKADENRMTEESYLSQLAMSIDKAVNSSFAKSTSNQQHVFKISLVTGIPLYGFHMKEEIFLKIFIYNPALTRKIAGLLSSGCIMSRVFQPHESHIPYTLQALIDFKLYGMSYIKLSKVLFKLPLPTSTSKTWNVTSVDKSLVHEETRISSCELEVDGVAGDILNPHLANASSQEMKAKSANPGLLAVWQDEKMRRKRKKMKDRVTPPSSPKRKVQTTAKERQNMKEFKSVLRSLNSRNHSQRSDDASLNATSTQKQFSCDDSLVNLLEELSSQKKSSQKSSDVSFKSLDGVNIVLQDNDDDDFNEAELIFGENSPSDAFNGGDDNNMKKNENDEYNNSNKNNKYNNNNYNNDIDEDRLEDFLYQIEECDSMLSQVASDPRDLISDAIMLSQASNKSRYVCRGDDVGGVVGRSSESGFFRGGDDGSSEDWGGGDGGSSGGGSSGSLGKCGGSGLTKRDGMGGNGGGGGGVDKGGDGKGGVGKDDVGDYGDFNDDLLSLEMSMCFDPDKESFKAYPATSSNYTNIKNNQKRPCIEECNGNNKIIKKNEKICSQSCGENAEVSSDSISLSSSPEFSSSGEKIVDEFMHLTAIVQDDDSFQDSLADSLMCNYDSSMNATLTGGNSIDESQKFSHKETNDDGRVEGNVTRDSELNVFSQKPKTEDSPTTINKLITKFKKRRKTEEVGDGMLNDDEDEKDETLREYLSSSSDLDVLEKIAFASSPESVGNDEIPLAASIIGSSPSSTTPTSTTSQPPITTLPRPKQKTTPKNQQKPQKDPESIEITEFNAASYPIDSTAVPGCGESSLVMDNNELVYLTPLQAPPSYSYVMSCVDELRRERVRTGYGRHIIGKSLLDKNKDKFEFVPETVSDLEEFNGTSMLQLISLSYQYERENHEEKRFQPLYTDRIDSNINSDDDMYAHYIHLHPIKKPPSYSQVEKQLKIDKDTKDDGEDAYESLEISVIKSRFEKSDNKTVSEAQNFNEKPFESAKCSGESIDKNPVNVSEIHSPGSSKNCFQTPKQFRDAVITSTPFSSYKVLDEIDEAQKDETAESKEKQTKDLEVAKANRNKLKKRKCRKNIFKPKFKPKVTKNTSENVTSSNSTSILSDTTPKTDSQNLNPNISVIKKIESSLKSQVDQATPDNKFNFKVDSQCVEDTKESIEKENLNIISIELHISTRDHLLPDPEFDAVKAVCYCMRNERISEDNDLNPLFKPTNSTLTSNNGDQSILGPGNLSSTSSGGGGGLYRELGVLVTLNVLDTIPKDLPYLLTRPSLKVSWFYTELDLLQGVCELVQKNDCDILVGYEIEKTSWGFLIARASHLGLNLSSLLSPLHDSSENKQTKRPEDQQKGDKRALETMEEDMWEPLSHVKVPGRILINLWRILRYEVSLNNYTFENTAYHILHRRFPHFSYQYLTTTFESSLSLQGWKTLDYYLERCEGSMHMMEKLDLVGQTSEMCRIYGIEFFDVLNRGSQYRVESMMLRIAKPQNLIAVSPTALQRAQMDEPQCIPLNLEPVAGLYTHPVVVLDFQSLYPSVMIAHNYCFSTCLGRISRFESLRDGPIRFGCTNLYYSPELLKVLKKDINVCSNGVAFVKENVRKGVISQMVEEILKTRIMVKNSMKLHKGDKSLSKVLHSRQLSLKLIANVTFGYTAARLSGRMACVEVGDSIVRKARDIVEEAISLVERNRKWCAQVVYGDTDSLFVLLKGRSKSEAFVIGQEIEEAVTKANPKPIKLKLEKVLMPCMLAAKKRYAGLMFETAEQEEAQMLAKGIETIRRDNCPVVSKMLEKVLKILFNTFDLELVKSYVQKQCLKVIGSKLPMMDYIFGKEYRGMRYYKPGSCIPALEIARKNLARDRRSEPLRGERVPYVVVYGPPGLPLIRLVRFPAEMVADPTLRINTAYYILKQILPPINRFTSIIGVDAFQWYHDLPKIFGRSYFNSKTGVYQQNDYDEDFYGAFPVARVSSQSKLTTFFTSSHCPICDSLIFQGVCDGCNGDSQRKLLLVSMKLKKIEGRRSVIDKVCSQCMGWSEPSLPCESYDCSIFFKAAEIRHQRPLLQVLYNEIDF